MATGIDHHNGWELWPAATGLGPALKSAPGPFTNRLPRATRWARTWTTTGQRFIPSLWLANDNDFLQDLNGPGTNPNQFFVFGFTDADLAGSVLELQQAQGAAKKD